MQLRLIRKHITKSRQVSDGMFGGGTITEEWSDTELVLQYKETRGSDYQLPWQDVPIIDEDDLKAKGG